jgi:hypothetical protein
MVRKHVHCTAVPVMTHVLTGMPLSPPPHTLPLHYHSPTIPHPYTLSLATIRCLTCIARDIDEVRNIYEANKQSPQLERNVTPIAGRISLPFTSSLQCPSYNIVTPAFSPIFGDISFAPLFIFFCAASCLLLPHFYLMPLGVCQSFYRISHPVYPPRRLHCHRQATRHIHCPLPHLELREGTPTHIPTHNHFETLHTTTTPCHEAYS